MNTDQKEMLESTTALVWEHQRDIQELFAKAEKATASSSTEIDVIWQELRELKNDLSRLSSQVDSLAAQELL